MPKIIVSGASGRMGTRILELAKNQPSFEIVGGLESAQHPAIGKKILDHSVLLESEIEKYQGKAQVLIDFTAPKATLTYLHSIQHWKGISAVIGTTGFSKIEIETLHQIAKNIPIVMSPNMSVGVNLLFDLVHLVAQKIPDYDIEIIEAHHNQKKDAPSGTALGLAKEITEALHRSLENDLQHGRKGEVGARTKKEIGMHAIRAGDIVGDHTVIFATQGERIELTHRASSRDAFASGALRAAQWIVQQKPGFYSMKDVLSAR